LNGNYAPPINTNRFSGEDKLSYGSKRYGKLAGMILPQQKQLESSQPNKHIIESISHPASFALACVGVTVNVADLDINHLSGVKAGWDKYY
jgi:hypothetical protein